jgi:hypothetical protein
VSWWLPQTTELAQSSPVASFVVFSQAPVASFVTLSVKVRGFVRHVFLSAAGSFVASFRAQMASFRKKVSSSDPTAHE